MRYVRWPQLAQAQSSKPTSLVDAGLDAVALDHASEEAAGKGITCTSGVYDLVLVDLVDGERLWLTLVLHSNDGGVSALRNDCDTLALLVLFGQVCEVLGNRRNVVGLKIVRVSVGLRLRLVADNVIPVRSGLVERFLEELWDERRGQRKDERLGPSSACQNPGINQTTTDLVRLRGFLGQLQDSRYADCQVVATDEVCLGLLCDAPVLVQVFDLVAVGCGKVCAHAPVVSCNNHTATTGRFLLIDMVSNGKTGLLVGILEDIGVLVLSDGAEEDY